MHNKPIFLVDIQGYWQPLHALLQHVVDQGFASDSLLQFVSMVPDVPALEASLRDVLS